MIGYHMKIVGVLLLLLGVSCFTSRSQQIPTLTSPEENWANFNEVQLDYIRSVIRAAITKYSFNYEMVSLYIQLQVNETLPSFWNVAVYRKTDQNTNFYLTGLPDSTHIYKRYYQVSNLENYAYSILILESNNTDVGSSKTKEKMVSNLLSQKESKSYQMNRIQGKNLQSDSDLPVQSGLQYTKRKSAKVTTSQEAGIDLAITTAYTWNKNVVDFTKVLQRLTLTNLNQHWQICTRLQNLSYFSFVYTSPYDEWIEYSQYGLGSYVLRVFMYRNYING